MFHPLFSKTHSLHFLWFFDRFYFYFKCFKCVNFNLLTYMWNALCHTNILRENMTLNVFETVLQNLCFKTYYDKIKMYTFATSGAYEGKLRANPNVKISTFLLEKDRKYLNFLGKNTYFSLWKQRTNVLLNLLQCYSVDVWICSGSCLSFYFYLIEAQLGGLETTLSFQKMIFSYCFRARRWTPQSPETLSLVLPAVTKAGVCRSWGCSE